MARVKRGTKRRARRKKYLKRTKRVFPNKEQAVSIGAGSGESRGTIFIPRSPQQKAPVPPLVDSARGSCDAKRRTFVQSVYCRTESRGHHHRPQSYGGYGREGRERIHAIGGASESCVGRRETRAEEGVIYFQKRIRKPGGSRFRAFYFCGSLVSQSHERIDTAGASRGQPTCERGNHGE